MTATPSDPKALADAVRRGERMLRVGSIGFSLQGSRHVDAWWDQVADPENVHSRVRRAIERALD